MRNGAENMCVDETKEDRTLADILDSVVALAERVNTQSAIIDEYLLTQYQSDEEEIFTEPFTMRQKLLEMEGTLRSATNNLSRIQGEVEPRLSKPSN